MASDVLVKRTHGIRQRGHVLKRFMIELGIEYKCVKCNLSEWREGDLSLHVDHIDGDKLNDSVGNLRFLCPNCHFQTKTYGSKNCVKRQREKAVVWIDKYPSDVVEMLLKNSVSVDDFLKKIGRSALSHRNMTSWKETKKLVEC